MNLQIGSVQRLFCYIWIQEQDIYFFFFHCHLMLCIKLQHQMAMGEKDFFFAGQRHATFVAASVAIATRCNLCCCKRCNCNIMQPLHLATVDTSTYDKQPKLVAGKLLIDGSPSDYDIFEMAECPCRGWLEGDWWILSTLQGCHKLLSIEKKI